MRAILVDDENMALEVLEKNLSKFKDIEVVESYTNPMEALKDLEQEQVDVIFLDIEMGTINGLEIAQEFLNKRRGLEIVFVTAYSQYAVEAFRVNALDYLLKPVQEKRLKETIDRLKQKFKEKNLKEKRPKKPGLNISTFGKFEVRYKSGNHIAWRTQKAKELFAYLWLRGEKASSKAVIIEKLFSNKNTEKASTILYTTVYQIRRNLENAGFSNPVIYKNENYILNLPIERDIDQLEELLDKEKPSEEDIEKILDIYRGDLFQEEGYSWALDIQQNYKNQVFNKIEKYVGEKLEKGRNKSQARQLYKWPYKNRTLQRMCHPTHDKLLRPKQDDSLHEKLL